MYSNFLNPPSAALPYLPRLAHLPDSPEKSLSIDDILLARDATIGQIVRRCTVTARNVAAQFTHMKDRRIIDLLLCKGDTFGQHAARWRGRWNGKTGCKGIPFLPPMLPQASPEGHGLVFFAMSSLIDCQQQVLWIGKENHFQADLQEDDALRVHLCRPHHLSDTYWVRIGWSDSPQLEKNLGQIVLQIKLNVFEGKAAQNERQQVKTNENPNFK